jgi:3-methyl-2-oxobutanoate hydroxymethyltransferase
VDHDLCVGNGTCLTIAPAVFAHNAHRQSEVIDAAGASESVILHAAANCPVGAISVALAESGEALPIATRRTAMAPSPARARITTTELVAMKREQRKIVMLTAYDSLFASLIDQAGVDVILVGDSVGPVLAGESSTLPVTVKQMIYHGRSVQRGTAHALVVVDLPFLSYQVSPEEATRHGGKVLKRTGASAVKLEGGRDFAPAVHALVTAGIPVMGHLGLTPQSLNVLGGIHVHGRDASAAQRLIDDAQALEEAGAFGIVLELIGTDAARRITESITIPTIGIGSGPHCDGQVLVLHDMLGLNEQFHAKFVKRFAELGASVRQAVATYADEVRSVAFPDEAHSHKG